MRMTNQLNHGLTLIECLLGLTVLVILAGLLGIRWDRARKSAQRASCLNTVRSLGLACKQYAVDNDNRFPAGGPTAVACFAQLTNGYVSAGRIFNCPSDHTAKFGPAFGAGGCSNSYSYITVDAGGMVGSNESKADPDQPLLADKGCSPTNAALSGLSGSRWISPHGTGGCVYHVGGHVKFLARLGQPGSVTNGWILVPQ